MEANVTSTRKLIVYPSKHSKEIETAEIIFIEDILKLRNEGDSILLTRRNASGLSCLAYLESRPVIPNGRFNMNVETTVKLTNEGEKILKEHFKLYPSLIKIDENKIYRAPLWEMMHIFGKHLYNGCKIPFENNSIMLAVSV